MPVSDPVQINDVKSILRSLLISKNSRDVTIQSLNSLYKQMRGTNIPYREFNCTTLENFLSSIPDTLNLQYNRNNQLCAYHVPTQNTAHISALIAKQKKPSKKSKSPFSYRSRSNAYQGQTVRRYSAPQSFMRDHPMQSSSICSNYSYSTLAPSSGLYTASIKKNNTYISHTQTNNVQHTSLQTNPKFFTEQTIYNHGIVEQDKHSTQFINGKPTIVDQYKPPIVDHYKPPIHVITNILEQLKQSLGPNSNCGIRKSDVVTKIKEKIGSHSLYTIQDLNCQLNNLLYMLDIKEDYIYFKDLLENQEKNILSAKIQKLNISDDFGFLPADKSNNVQNNLNNDNEDEESLTEKKNENDIVKKRTKIRLEKLLDKHPEGIWCSELPNLYKTEYNIDLEYHDLGFNNIFEFVAALPDIFIVMEPPNTNRQMVISAKRNENADFSLQKKTLASVYNFHDYTAREREPVPDKLSSEVSKKLIPEGVMNFNDTIDQILVSSFSGEDCIEVNVSEIFTPSFFWITLRKNKKKFKEMMSDLEIFYESQDLDVYRIPQLLLKSGLNVACVYANVWHRGIIKKMKPDGYAVILFYDFGTIKSYHPQNLYFLNKRFSTLPAQAIPCGLHNIKPVNGTKEWSAESTNMFNSKVWNLPLIAITLSTDDKNNSMMITLTDTSDDIIDLHINDWMVENGLAEWGKMVHEVPIHQMYLYDEVLQNKLNDELFKQELKQKKVDNINNNSSIYTDHRDSPFINPIPNTKYNDSSNITNLVKENMDLTKQTNTLAQAILLNLPTTSINVPKETTTEASTKIIDKKLEFEALKQFDTEFQKNIKTIEVNISEVNSTSKSHIQNTVKFGKDKTENNFDDRSLGQSLYSQPSSYDIRSNQTDLQNGNLERRSSVYSMYSNNSNLDSHSVSQTHNVQNINSYRNYIDNEVDFIDGSPFFEIKINSNLPKTNCINIKYPAHFAAKHCNQSEVQNHIQVNDAENCNGALQHSEKDEEYNIKKSVSPTRKNSKSLFSTNTIPSTSSILTVITLSQKCEKKLIHLLHLYEGGWVCVSEFVDAFTNLKDQRVMFKLLQFLKYEVDFRLLTRESDPQLFSLLDKSDLKVPRDEYKKIIPNFVLNVMPIKATLKVLDKLDFLNTQMLKDALHLMKKCTGNLENVIYEQFNNKILYDVLNLVMQYKHFKKLHSQSK